jgi:ParB-like chromosome segregation protein Spo0J
MSLTLNDDQFVRGKPSRQVRVADLTPTQVYVDGAKVDRMKTKPARDLPPIVVGKDGRVMNGHHRLAAAVERGHKTLRAVVL